MAEIGSMKIVLGRLGKAIESCFGRIDGLGKNHLGILILDCILILF